ncbi:MAG: hypothetical protein ABIQ12_09685 [Opitutaceae bacterium]
MFRFFISLHILAISAAAADAGSPRAATPGEVTQLNEVLQKVAADYRRWAYTEHRIVRDEKGRPKSDVILRYDPSQPYPEQWVPLKVDGKEPSERELAKYRRKGEREAPHDAARTGHFRTDNSRNRQTLGELIDVPRSSIASESDTHLVFEIPLLKFGNERFPPEKFQVLARVRKEGQVLENIAVRLRESFRSKLVVKVKSGDGSLDFEIVNPKYPPALVGVTGDASVSVLFVSIGGSVELKRTDIKHVKPFDERFEVQIGGLKAIDF